MDTNDLTHILRRMGTGAWSEWRANNPLTMVNLVGADLSGADLRGVDFRGAILSESQFIETDLRGAECFAARFTRCDLSSAKLNDAQLRQSNFRDGRLTKADLTGANLEAANLVSTNLDEAILRNANLQFVQFAAASLRAADLTDASLCGASMVTADLEGATLLRVNVWGVSAWDLRGKPRVERDLLVTLPNDARYRPIRVDDLEIAQFVYQLVRSEGQGKILSTMADKAVLVLGRFAEGGLEVLYRIADWLREREYIPVIFDFERPEGRSLTETVQTLAGLSRMVVVDLSGPSVPQELAVTVKNYMMPFIPVLERGREITSLTPDILHYPWVVSPILTFSTLSELLEQLGGRIALAEELIESRRARLKTLDEVQ